MSGPIFSRYGTFDDPKWINGVILRRRAMKSYRCGGDGRATKPEHAGRCTRSIEPGQAYAEYVGETPSFQSGLRVSMVCAEAFFVKAAR